MGYLWGVPFQQFKVYSSVFLASYLCQLAGVYNPPDSQHSEGAILHTQCQVDAVSAHCCTADGLLHITACY